MLEFIVSIDVMVVKFIQDFLRWEWLEPIIRFFSKEESLYFAVPLLIFGFIKNWKKTCLFFIFLVLSVALTDQSAYHLKKNFPRVRPNQAGYEAAQQTNKSSFPSAHVSNITGAFFIIVFFWPILRYPMFVVWVLVVYGRMFLNKHYPSDVLTGMFIGTFHSQLLLKLLLPFLQKKFPKLTLGLETKKPVEVN